MIYFVQGGQERLIKIGRAQMTAFSPDMTRRLKQIQSSSPDRVYLIATVEGDHKTENQLHHMFRQYHSHGEWFYPDKTLTKWIAEHAQGCCVRAEVSVPHGVR